MPRRAKILVVDDSKVIRSVVRHELGETYAFREATNGLEALQVIRDGFLPDLITLDVEMPELDGFATCERLYGGEFGGLTRGPQKRRVPIVFLTARDSLAERRRGYELGALDFVSKKFEPGALAALVAQILKPGDRLRGMRVLLVDDSGPIRQLVGSALRDVGVEVIEAGDGLEAYTIMCNQMSSIDLVITDIAMPAMTGTELCRRIRREIGLTDLPIVFLTVANQGLRLEAFQAGATDCLVKPFFKEEMIARLTVHIERALFNRRLRRAVDDLRTSMERQRDILATLSHDMRAPLSGIMGFADVLLLARNRTPTELENIDLIRQSGQMLLSLVDDILLLSKQEAGRNEIALQPLELPPLLARCAALFQGLAAAKGQQLKLTCNTAEATIAGHAESLTRVFNNLISNAHKFTPTGGLIHLTVDATPEGKVVVSVTDTGVGIDAEQLAQVFDRYSTAARKGTAGEASTGLGMSITREFVLAHHGEISVTSTPGRGTQFRVSFPLHTAAPAAAGRTSDRSSALSRTAESGRVRGYRVLVADDNPINHLVAQAVLNQAGCTVTTASGGAEALALLIARPGEYDLVLMDMRMPDMDGLTATQEIRKAGLFGLPVVALTGGASERDHQACLAAGMNGFLTKPFSARALLETIQRFCPPQKGVSP